jgi:hypothetical protein
MINVGKKVIDLNLLEDSNEYTVKISSHNDEGRIIPWMVDYTSSDTIKYDEVGINELRLSFDLRNLKNEEIIRVKNSKGEKEEIKVLPNIKESAERKYTFRVRSHTILDKNKAAFKITSKVNGEKCKWSCTYNGRPLSYIIKIEDNDTLIVELTSIIFCTLGGVIELTQDESGKRIILKLTHHKDEKMEVSEIKLINC